MCAALGGHTRTEAGDTMAERSTTRVPSWVPDLTSREVTTQRILDIVHTPMRHEQRNKLVTIAYQDLADQMAKVLSPGNANWCTFSQWPSSTVGMFMGLPVPLLGEGIGRAFGHGNRGVFSDIGQSYVAFLETVAVARPTNLTELLGPLEECAKRLNEAVPAPGTPVWDLEPAAVLSSMSSVDLRDENQTRFLFEAVSCYGMSLIEPDPAAKARLIYAGTLNFTAHEQRWLGESLAASMRVPLRRLLHPTLNLKSQRDFRTAEVGDGCLLDIEEGVIHALTERAIGFRFNGRWVPVGADLPSTAPGEVAGMTDPDLMEPGVTEVVRAWPRRTSARCWLSFEQRMGFIAQLFMLHQHDDIGRARHGVRVRADRTEAPISGQRPDRAGRARGPPSAHRRARRRRDPLVEPPRPGPPALGARP